MLGKSKKAKVADIDTLIGQHTEVEGDVRFKGGLHVNGVIKGNVIAEQDSSSVLVLSEQGRIEGEVRVPHVILNGTVTGDVHAGERIELAARARVTGNVFYNLIEMAMGAEVNGNLVHRAETAASSVVALSAKTGDRESAKAAE
ncbi:MAG: polymer-forming cytoskeletal protein [Gammaproteobacteria bacterium]